VPRVRLAHWCAPVAVQLVLLLLMLLLLWVCCC
jgi:hypothetical protein